jgi:hypothetical protein
MALILRTKEASNDDYNDDDDDEGNMTELVGEAASLQIIKMQLHAPHPSLRSTSALIRLSSHGAEQSSALVPIGRPPAWSELPGSLRRPCCLYAR